MKTKKTAKKGKQPSRKKSAAVRKEEKAAPAKPVRASGRDSGTDKKKKRVGAAVTVKAKAYGKTGRPAKAGVRPEAAETSAAARMKTRERHYAAIKEIVPLELPEEYGENDFFLIPVEPRVVYASWEITKDSLPGGEDDLEVRFFEVTGGQEEWDARAFLGIDISGRVGSAFFNVGIHGREVIAEIGSLGVDGHFRPLLRSRRVLIPSSLEPDDFDEAVQLPEKGNYGSRPPDK